MTGTPTRHRATEAALSRTLKAAKRVGLTAEKAVHHPNGIVELVFSDSSTILHSNTSAYNEWDT
jgi:pterin-4a-carbinolamine dehydratase